MSVIPITDQSGNVYKGYKGDGNAYMEIYEEPRTGKWKSEIVSRFDANQKGFTPNWRRVSPTAKMVMRLRINDLLKLTIGGEIYRLQKITGTRIFLAPHREANVDSRDRSSDDPFKYLVASAGTLQSKGAVKLNVSPTGLTLED